MKTVDHVLESTGMTAEELAERSGLTLERVRAIASGRWTPSPSDREKIANAFGMSVGEISWGHSMTPRNIRYHQYGLPEDFEPRRPE